MRAPHEPCTQSRALRNSSSTTATRCRLMTNRSPEFTGPRTLSAFCWNTCHKDNSITTLAIKMHYRIGQDTYFKQMMASTETNLQRTKRQDVTYVRVGPLERPLRCGCSSTKGWYSARQSSILLPLTHPLSRSPSRSNPNRWSDS